MTLMLNYFYLSKSELRIEANLETHSDNDQDGIYIDNAGFQELANNLGVNLEEFRFKYSTVSEICEHSERFSERCYDLYKVLHIFTELKAGLSFTSEYRCCFSKISLCSAEMRDVICRNQISVYPPGFPVNGGECLLNDGVHWGLSTQRLRAQGVLFYIGPREYTIEKSPINLNEWQRCFKKQKSAIKKALRLDNQTTLIYRDKENLSEYY